MAQNSIIMPQMGESITTGTITKWHKAIGDTIDVDEILLEISTDKVESEIPSPFGGRVEMLLFEEGDTVDVGVPIAVIEDDPSSTKPLKKDKETSSKEKKLEPTPSAPSLSASKEKTSRLQRRFYTPLVKNMAKQMDIELHELENIIGSGAGDRVNKKDLLHYAQTRKPQKAISKTVSFERSAPSLQGTQQADGRMEIIPMNNMRKAIAKNMIESKMTSPHVNSFDEVDMTTLVKFREQAKDDFKREEGFALTYTHFILYALIQTLKKYPMVNSSIDGDNIIVKKDINLGCAVAVPGSGLVVPVIKNADGLNLTGLARRLHNLVNKARNKKLTIDDLSGGTYTFTNNGSFGVLTATPVILQPQVAIFCVGAIKKRPIITDGDALAIRQMMYATHTYDHRIIDGELGSLFLKHVVHILETVDPSTLF